MRNEEIKKLVRQGYAKIAQQPSGCCCTQVSSCCSSSVSTQALRKNIGYSEEELSIVPEGANLGLGCGNPVALASLKSGETVLDLGSGAGFDCFLAAQQIGEKGKVIGVDMTPEMIDKATENARKGNYANVEFRLGEIENLPVANNSVDVLISNCVINLSPDKSRVFAEAYRVIKSGGRLMVSDIVVLKELPDFIKTSVEAYVGCLSGALIKSNYLGEIKAAGFEEVKIIDETTFPLEVMINDAAAQTIIKAHELTSEDLNEIARAVRSIKVSGIKPD